MRPDDHRIAFLNAMGVQVWGSRDAVMPENGPAGQPGNTEVATSAPATPMRADDVDEAPAQPLRQPAVTDLGWDELGARVAACEQCALHKGRTQTVFGTGNRAAEWLIVGEAPGAEEDAQGEPFVGRAGQLLNAMIRAVGAEREQLYIANIVKCRPPSNRNPRADEAGSCAPFLQRQIELIQPRLILAVGRVAANNLLGNEKTLGSMRGQVYEFSPTGTPLVVTYHPAYLLRKPSEKAKAWQDLQLAMSVSSPLAG